MNVKTPKIIAREWIKAFNSHNLKNLLALYHPDAVHTSPKLRAQKPETQGQIKGKAALKTWWQGAFVKLPSLYYELERLAANDECVFMEYTRTVEGELSTKVVEVLEIKDEVIVASRVYYG